jgi:translation initiation factor IF-1
MSKEDYMQCQGIVMSARGNGNFLVHVPELNTDVSCQLSGKIRKNTIRILDGDRVAVDVSTYDTSKGRITYRFKK